MADDPLAVDLQRAAVVLVLDRRPMRVGQSMTDHQTGEQFALVALAIAPGIQALVEGVTDFLDQDLDRRVRVGVGQAVRVDIDLLPAVRPMRGVCRSCAPQVRVVSQIDDDTQVAALDDRHAQGLGARLEHVRIGAGVAECLEDEAQERVRASGEIAQQIPCARQRQIQRTGRIDHPRPLVFPGGHGREFPLRMRQYSLGISTGPEE